MGQAFPAPTFGHAAEAFLIANAAPGAWSAGTAVNAASRALAPAGVPSTATSDAAAWPAPSS